MPKPALAFVIAHYHPTGRVPQHLYDLIVRLHALSRRIVFVSTGISDDQIVRLEPFARVIRRENFGYDFWSYRVGIDSLGDLSAVDRLVLLNSSFVTIYPRLLIPHFTMPVIGKRVRGLTESRHPSRHLQSYCLMFDTPALLASEPFRQWWGELTPLSDREEVILHQELGLSAHFVAARIRMVPVFEPEPTHLARALCRYIAGLPPTAQIGNISADGRSLLLPLKRGYKLNPSHFLWDALLERTGILKIELVRDNPMDLGLQHLRKALEHKVQAAALVADALVGEMPREARRAPAIHEVGLGN